MIFPYWGILGKHHQDLLPVISILAHGPRASVEVHAIIDSGAEHNALDIAYASKLGVNLELAERFEIIGFGREAAAGYRDIIEWQLGRYRWTAPIVFVDSPNQFNILGQAGFFAFFDVDFRYKKREIYIRKVRM